MALMDTLIGRFTKDAPGAVMTRALFANILAPKELDTIFQDCAEKQYEGELLFSTAVHLLASAVTRATACAQRDVPTASGLDQRFSDGGLSEAAWSGVTGDAGIGASYRRKEGASAGQRGVV